MLHITNGDSTVRRLARSGVPGTIFAWRDILHEGPTPSGLTLEQMSRMRARFIADNTHEPYEKTLSDFEQRDRILAHFRDHEEVVLWFEHDLYDQLQLLQLLAWFASEDQGATKLSLICIDRFPGIEPFWGLGQLAPTQLASLLETRQTISAQMLSLGDKAWTAYCSSDPTELEAIIQKDTSALLFLRNALLRHLEQFPALENGLSRTERQILETVSAGMSDPVAIFRADQNKEESPFMGDTPFWNYIYNLCAGPGPLVECTNHSKFTLPHEHDETFLQQRLVLTKSGQGVLDGHEDWITLRQGIDSWLGGVHLQGQNAAWRWDRSRRMLVQQEKH
jgi:Domain of unknown function (DUF1835)